jgi:hypothetical protein
MVSVSTAFLEQLVNIHMQLAHEELSDARTVFSRSNTGIVVGSNPTRVMDVCVCLFRVCVVLCVGSGLATG